jgi:hypothetical protein
MVSGLTLMTFSKSAIPGATRERNELCSLAWLPGNSTQTFSASIAALHRNDRLDSRPEPARRAYVSVRKSWLVEP